MIRITLRLAAAIASVLALATSAFAQVAAGDWTGAVAIPPTTYHLGIHVEGAGGALKGTIGSNETGRWGTPLENLKLENGVLSFSVPTTKTTYTGRWDASASAWTGDYIAAGKSYPLKLVAGVPAPLPIIAGIDGRWEGILEIAAANAKLRLVLRIVTDVHGTRLVMDSPDQMASDIPGANLKRDGAHVAFDIPSIRSHYEGDLSIDGASLTGIWSQGPQKLPLVMQHVSADVSVQQPKRPQTPKPPYPYMEENVFIDNSAATGVTLACTVSLPPGAKPHPAAVLITGSGPEDRDETIFGHKPFLILSDHLTRKGIAVLRCDDRGMAKSTGTFLTAELKDFASDVQAELAFLRSRKDIDTKRIGLIGHSEGGVIGPMIAAEDHGVAFLVMMAGLGVTGEELAIEQRALILGSMGATPAQMDASRIASRKLFDAVLAAPDQAGAIAAAKQQLQAEAKESGITEAATDAAAMQFASTSLLSLLAYDPAPVLKKVAAPILAINGSKDLQVPPSQNLGGLRKILAGRRNVTIVELPGLNHLFQTTKTGRISEYAEIEETISPLALNTISDWLVKTVTP